MATVPALFLVRPPDDLRPLGQGTLALDQLTARMLSVAAEAGWIEPAEYTRTRPVRTDWTLPVEGTGLTEDVLNDPARLVEVLRPGGWPSNPPRD